MLTRLAIVFVATASLGLAPCSQSPSRGSNFGGSAGGNPCDEVNCNASPGSTSHAVFWVGHSLIGFKMPYMVGEITKSLGLTYTWAVQIINGSALKSNWLNSSTAQGADARVELPKGDYDVLIMTEAVPLLNHTTWSDSGLYAGLFHDLIAGQPGAQTYMHETWHCLNTGTAGGCAYDEDDFDLWRPRISRDHALWQSIVTEVNLNRPAPKMQLAPVGTAMGVLYDEIVAGNVPGITSINDVFKDNIHPNNKGWYYVALVYTSILYGVDVRGATYNFNDEYGNPYPDLPTQAQATAMQNIAHSWYTTP